MAKAAMKKASKRTTKPVKPVSRSVAAATKTKTVKSAAPAKKPAAVKAPAVSKDELRVQLEKAQSLIAALRVKGREALRASKAAAAQIAELEAKLAQLEKKLAAQEKSTNPVSTAVKSAKPRGRKVTVKPNAGMPLESADTALAESETPAD